MPLWGTGDTKDAKPKIFGRSLLADGITNDPRAAVYGTTAGWVQPGTGRGTTDPEVLVAIRGLTTRSGTATGFTAGGMAEANITSYNWNITTFDKSDGGTLSVTANFNEGVTVTGTPQLTVTNDQRANHTLNYASGTGTNRLTFTLAIGAADAATNAGDVLSIGTNAMAHNGGSTIVDTISTNAAVITNIAGIGTAVGTITVVA